MRKFSKWHRMNRLRNRSSIDRRSAVKIEPIPDTCVVCQVLEQIQQTLEDVVSCRSLHRQLLDEFSRCDVHAADHDDDGGAAWRPSDALLVTELAGTATSAGSRPTSGSTSPAGDPRPADLSSGVSAVSSAGTAGDWAAPSSPVYVDRRPRGPLNADVLLRSDDSDGKPTGARSHRGTGKINCR